MVTSEKTDLRSRGGFPQRRYCVSSFDTYGDGAGSNRDAGSCYAVWITRLRCVPRALEQDRATVNSLTLYVFQWFRAWRNDSKLDSWLVIHSTYWWLPCSLVSLVQRRWNIRGSKAPCRSWRGCSPSLSNLKHRYNIWTNERISKH